MANTTANTNTRPLYAPNYTGPRLFGAPVGDFSAFQTLLITFATGVASFFAATFFAIVTLLVVSQAGHRKVDFSIAYRLVGMPVGILMLVLTAGYLGALLVRRIKNKGGSS
jgi:hypothetical protein